MRHSPRVQPFLPQNPSYSTRVTKKRKGYRARVLFSSPLCPERKSQTILLEDELEGDYFLLVIFKDEEKPLFQSFLCRGRASSAF
jgi:hypothetical protein